MLVALVVAFTATPPSLDLVSTGKIGFQAPAGAAVTCELDGVGTITCGSPFSYRDLTDGEHSLHVTATRGGDTGDATFRWTIETNIAFEVIQEKPTKDPATGKPVYPFTFDPPEGRGIIASCTFDGTPIACATTGVTIAGPLAVGDHLLEVHMVDRAGNAWTARGGVSMVAMSGPSPKPLGCDPVVTEGDVELRSCDANGERNYTLAIHDAAGWWSVPAGSIYLDGGAYGSSNCCVGHEGTPRGHVTTDRRVGLVTAGVELPTWRTYKPHWGETGNVPGSHSYGFTVTCDHRVCSSIGQP